MSGIFERLTQENEVIKIGANLPITLNQKSFWCVVKGTVDIFVIQTDENNSWGRRTHIFEVGAGKILFGFQHEANSGHLMIGVGSQNTELVHISYEKFFDIYRDDSSEKQLVSSFGDFIHLFCKGIDDLCINQKNTCYQDNLLLINSFNQSPDRNVFVEIVNKFTQNIFATAVKTINQNIECERHRLKNKNEKDVQFMDSAIHSMADVVNLTKKTGDISAEDTPIFRACQMIGSYLCIMFKKPMHTGVQKTHCELIKDISDTSHIRFRKVLLKDNWMMKDNGPILAFMEEDDRPIALIPLTPGKYQVFDTLTNEIQILKCGDENKIKSEAYIFYKPMPLKVITLKDIFLLGSKDVWKKDYITLITLGLLAGLIGMAIPIGTGILFDLVIPQCEPNQLLQMGLFLLMGTFSTTFFNLSRTFATIRIESKITTVVQSAIWDRLLSLPSTFYRKFSSGELAERAMGINNIREILSGLAITTIFSSIFSTFNLILLFFYNTHLAFISITLVMVLLIVTMILALVKIKSHKTLIELSNKNSGFSMQILSGIPKLRVSGAEKRIFYLWAKLFGKQKKISFRNDLISNAMTSFNVLFPTIMSIIIFYYYINIGDSSLTAGKFLAFNSALASFSMAIMSLSETLITLVGIIPIYENSKPILETLPEHDADKLDPGELNGAIELNNINFKYDNDELLVLKNVSVSIKPGEYIAIVGSSGSGKSTLLRILLGFEKPLTGKVYYDGKDLDKIDIKKVRRQLGVVLQNSQILSGDIYENIVGANINLTLEDAWEAAQMSGLREDIERMPMGMNTVLNEGASTLSGGQRQRLMIARALIHKPKILYFDEATSALDNQTQAIVSQSLEKLKATRIVIAHRLSTVINCDKIFVMDKGRLVESGTYEELMKHNRVFAELAKRQLA